MRFTITNRKALSARSLRDGRSLSTGELLLNRAGTTFRKLSEADRQDIDCAKAIDLMLAQPSLIKRPVLDMGGRLLVGFKPDVYAKALG